MTRDIITVKVIGKAGTGIATIAQEILRGLKAKGFETYLGLDPEFDETNELLAKHQAARVENYKPSCRIIVDTMHVSSAENRLIKTFEQLKEEDSSSHTS